MELQGLDTSVLDARPITVDLVEPRPSGRPRTLSCRCPGCGNEVTFDALVVTCACTDDTDRSALH